MGDPVSFWGDLINTVEQMVALNPAGVSNPQGPAVAAAGSASAGQITAILGIWSDLRDGKMWRSLGWLFLGIALMFLGVAWWIGPSASRMGPAGAAGVVRRGLT